MVRVVFMLLITFLVCFTACTKTEDHYYREYLDAAEIALAGRVGSLVVNPGKFRAEVEFIVPPDRRVKKIVIEYLSTISDEVKMLELDLIAADYGQKKKVVLNNLTEATLIVNVTTVAVDNSKSNIFSVTGRVYGDRYESTLANRLLSFLDEEDGFVYLEFLKESGLPQNHSLFIPMQYTEVVYTDVNNDVQEVVLSPYEDYVILDNVKLDEIIKFRTFYKPLENAIDIFPSNWKEIEIAL